MNVIAFEKQTVAPAYDHPREDRRVDGNPQRTTWVHYLNASGRVNAGIWTCEPGCWRIVFAANKCEFFSVISGRVCLHSEDGSFAEIGPGEAAVIPEGFAGRFEVLEAVRKYYVVIETHT